MTRLERARLESPDVQPAERAQVFTRDPLWYKDAVIYQLHVKSFFDSNNDGIGDFPGLLQKLDYIVELGVNTVWLLPFYPSPRRDDGYDIADYRGVHADYGDLGDVRQFIRQAHRRGLRVITELVLNHTSDQHPWFQRARRARRGSSLRDFYVWSDVDTKYDGTRIIFLDTEKSNWTWDPVANAYYWHRFYAHQPDLNFDNPQVLKAVLSVMRFWLDLGVDGLRLDAVPYLIEREGSSNENLPETHDILKRIRAEIDRNYPDRMLLAEANQWPEDTQEYFGSGDECHMAFHFPLMPRMYMALAQEDRFPITDILRQTPDIPANCQWAIFLRNHDELTLEMVTDRERDYLWAKYASDQRARLNLGIRRRLAPLLERDRRRVELLNSLLLSMPGTPVLYYGDELGMGDNIHLGDRDGVRTPMQWSPDRNGGFSRADPATLVLPPIMDPLYGFQSVNVEAQARDPHSLLNSTRRLLEVRKQQKAFGRGRLKMLYPSNRRVLAYLREYQAAEGGAAEAILCVANVSRAAQAVELDLSAFVGRVPVEMLGGSKFPPVGQLPYLLTLPPYGFYWFLLAAETQMPAWHVPAPEPMPEYITLVVRKEFAEIQADPARRALETESLPVYLPMRRWYAGKDRKLLSARIVAGTMLTMARPPILLAEIEATTTAGTDRYLLPLSFLADDASNAALPQQLALARLRRSRRVGFLTDACAMDALPRLLLELLREDKVLPSGDGELRFRSTERMRALELPPDAEVRRLAAEQSNSSVVLGERVILKIVRHLAGGVHPEIEMGRALTERGYANVAPLLGEVTRVAADGTPFLLALVQGFMDNQGDAWSWIQNILERAIQDLLVPPDAPQGEVQSAALAEIERFAAVLGQRLGQMHVVLAQETGDPAFAPERVSAQDCAEIAALVRGRIDEAMRVLAAPRDWASAEDAALAQWLLARNASLAEAALRLAAQAEGSLRIRIHGDLHLGQALVVQGDACFIDFEGEPTRPLQERRAKASPLRDVGGMVRSFHYAAALASAAGAGVRSDAAFTAQSELLQRFREGAVKTFVGAYRLAARAIPHAWKNTGAEEDLIQLFCLEKAAYEIAYEAAHRPAKLPVPLRGMAELAARIGTPERVPVGA